jgi:hypothetical protein
VSRERFLNFMPDLLLYAEFFNTSYTWNMNIPVNGSALLCPESLKRMRKKLYFGKWEKLFKI